MNALLIDRENRQKLQIAFLRLLSFGFRFEYFANALLTYYRIVNLQNICKILKPMLEPKTQIPKKLKTQNLWVFWVHIYLASFF